MKNGLKRALCAASVAPWAFMAMPAAAQSAEDSLTVGVNVEIDSAGAVVSGLQDFTIDFDGTGGSGQIYDKAQQFCIYSPTQFFDLTIKGDTVGSDSTEYNVIDIAQTDKTLQLLRYNLRLYDNFKGDPIGSDALGFFQNDISETNIDGFDFNIDATCTDGPNVELRFAIVLTGDAKNGPVVSQLVDGQAHSYTDTVTVILTPTV